MRTRSLAFLAALTVLPSLGACSRSKDGDIVIKRPEISVKTTDDTVHPPTITTKTDTVNTPVVGTQTETLVVKKPVVGTKKTTIQVPARKP